MLSNHNPPTAASSGGGSGGMNGSIPHSGGSAIAARHRQHRRQNSTPLAFEAVQIAPLPNFQNHHQHSAHRPSHLANSAHRRGLSLDVRRSQMMSPSGGPPTPGTPRHASRFQSQQQDQHQRRGSTVSNHSTNTGPATTTANNSTTTTTTTPPQQHRLQETQQQRIARPGIEHLQLQQLHQHQQQHQQHLHQRQDSFSQLSSPDVDAGNFLLSPHGTPHSARFSDGGLGSGPNEMVSFDAWAMSVNMKKNASAFAANQQQQNMPAPIQTSMAPEFEIFPDSTLSTPTFMTFPDGSSPIQGSRGWISEGEVGGGHSRRQSRRISGGIMDKVAKFEAMGEGQGQRPITPPNQNGASYFPPTPMETPHDRMIKHEHHQSQHSQSRPSRFAEDYDESMEETLKPVRRGHRANHSNRNSGIFAEMRQQAEASMHTTPPAPPPRANSMQNKNQNQNQNQNQMGFSTPHHHQRTHSHHHSLSGFGTPDFMNMSNVNAEFVKIESGAFEQSTAHLLAQISPDLSAHSGSPMTPQFGQFGSALPHLHPNHTGNAFDKKPDLSHLDFNSQSTIVPGGYGGFPELSSPHHSSSHRRTESLASIASAASIASLNIEETKTDTGVTMDDIATYIAGPDSADGKWLCTFEGCGKRFGRKENIKSHVQTHLNDRQYRCPTCRKCFVRQHDLKRHAKIHTGIKPYPCDCGNSFARHDALTRHRQRGMCIGAFDGVVRKVVKRGRPRKQRPDMEERKEKSERTRRKNSVRKAEGESSGSGSGSGESQSGYSDSSAVNSPTNEFDTMDNFGMLDVAMVEAGVVGLGVSSAPMTAAATVTVSPRMISATSPGTMSNYSHASVSLASIGGEPSLAKDGSNASRAIDLDLDDLPLPVLATIEPHSLPLLSVGSPAKSVASRDTYNTPPELSASSSPPPQTGASKFFELDGDESGDRSGLSDLSIGLGTTMAARDEMSAGGMDVHDDMLLQFGEDGLVPLDLGGGLQMGAAAKFGDDEYDAAVSMFTNTDEFLFGGS